MHILLTCEDCSVPCHMTSFHCFINLRLSTTSAQSLWKCRSTISNLPLQWTVVLCLPVGESQQKVSLTIQLHWAHQSSIPFSHNACPRLTVRTNCASSKLGSVRLEYWQPRYFTGAKKRRSGVPKIIVQLMTAWEQSVRERFANGIYSGD